MCNCTAAFRFESIFVVRKFALQLQLQRRVCPVEMYILHLLDNVGNLYRRWHAKERFYLVRNRIMPYSCCLKVNIFNRSVNLQPSATMPAFQRLSTAEVDGSDDSSVPNVNSDRIDTVTYRPCLESSFQTPQLAAFGTGIPPINIFVSYQGFRSHKPPKDIQHPE